MLGITWLPVAPLPAATNAPEAAPERAKVYKSLAIEWLLLMSGRVQQFIT
jgi:hypothetical protein